MLEAKGQLPVSNCWSQGRTCTERGFKILRAEDWEAGSAKERGNLTERDGLTSGTEKGFPAGDDGVLVNLLVGSQRWHQ